MRALAMYERAKDERSIAELLIQNARENPAAGHFYEMKRYYLALSEDTFKVPKSKIKPYKKLLKKSVGFKNTMKMKK